MFCNNCGAELVPGIVRCTACNSPVPALPVPAAATCPYCREEILAGAVKCKHCGEFLTRVQPKRGDGAAAVMSFFIPGLGQIYHGRIGSGLAWLFFVVLGYAVFIIPGLILHLACVVSAYKESKLSPA